MSDELEIPVSGESTGVENETAGGVAVAEPLAVDAAPTAEASEPGRPERKVRNGIIISNKMQKTVVVRVDRSVRHPLYGRTVTRSRHFKAHDEHNECGIGDRVEIRETRPLSKEKRWRVARIVERAK